MKLRKVPDYAAGVTATTFGVLAGLGGATHGVGEVIQGNVAVTGLALDSWTSGPIATNMGGEPGFTVLPTALAAGVATLLMSCAVLAWSVAGLRSRRGGLVLSVLSLGMLLAGGGVGPPIIGILAGAVGSSGPGRKPRWVGRISAVTRRRLASGWAPLFAVAVANGVLLVVGSVILVYTIDFNRPDLFEGSFYLLVAMLLLMMLTAPAHDEQLLERSSVPNTPRSPVFG